MLQEHVFNVIGVSFADKHGVDCITLDLHHLIDFLFQRLTIVFGKISNASISFVFVASATGVLGSFLFLLDFLFVIDSSDLFLSLLKLGNNL